MRKDDTELSLRREICVAYSVNTFVHAVAGVSLKSFFAQVVGALRAAQPPCLGLLTAVVSLPAEGEGEGEVAMTAIRS